MRFAVLVLWSFLGIVGGHDPATSQPSIHPEDHRRSVTVAHSIGMTKLACNEYYNGDLGFFAKGNAMFLVGRSSDAGFNTDATVTHADRIYAAAPSGFPLQAPSSQPALGQYLRLLGIAGLVALAQQEKIEKKFLHGNPFTFAYPKI